MKKKNNVVLNHSLPLSLKTAEPFLSVQGTVNYKECNFNIMSIISFVFLEEQAKRAISSYLGIMKTVHLCLSECVTAIATKCFA